MRSGRARGADPERARASTRATGSAAEPLSSIAISDDELAVILYLAQLYPRVALA